MTLIERVSVQRLARTARGHLVVVLDEGESLAHAGRVDGVHQLLHRAGGAHDFRENLRQTLIFGAVHHGKAVHDDDVVHRELRLDFLIGLLLVAWNAHIAVDHDILDVKVPEGKAARLALGELLLERVGRSRVRDARHRICAARV